MLQSSRKLVQWVTDLLLAALPHTLAERLCLSDLPSKKSCGSAAEAKPQNTKAADGKPEAFRKGSGKAAQAAIC